MLDHGVGLVLVDDAAPQQVADVRGQAVDRALVAVQREREIPAVGEPEVLVEASLERGCFALQPFGQLRVVPDHARRAGRSEFWRRRRSPGSRRSRAAAWPASRRRTGSSSRSPSSTGSPGRCRLTPLVLDVAVTVAVAVLVDPAQGAPRGRLELLHQVAIAGPALVLVQQIRNSGVESAAP